MKNFLKRNFFFLFIILIAALLRLYGLGNIPISLNPDETALGYNAYSIYKTGLDEYGSLPFALKSFGDWKLSGYPLVSIIPIVVFDLNEFSIRLPSAIAGIIQVILIYYLAFVIFKKKSIALLASLFLALSPWGIYFSRIAYEVNLATTYFLGGLLIILKYFENNKKYTKLLIIASILLSLTMLTYHAYIIFTPLFVFILTIVMRKQFKKDLWLYISIFILSIATIFSFYLIYQTSLNKFSDVSIVGDQRTIYNRSDIFRIDGSGEANLVARIFHNKYSGTTYQIAQNYLASFSPLFLFDKGGEKFFHNLGTLGNLYLIDVIFLLFGFISLVKFYDKKYMPLLIWLIIAPIPSAITKDAPSSTRLFIMLPALILVMSVGANTIMENFKNKTLLNRIFIFGLILFYIINVSYFIDAYFKHMNFQRARYLHYGFKQAVELSQKYPNHQVVMFGPENFPYISFLFYTKYDPVRYRKEVSFYPLDYAPFVFVKGFGKYHFVDNIDYDNMQPKTLYIDYRGIRKEDSTINYPSGEPAFKYFFKKEEDK